MGRGAGTMRGSGHHADPGTDRRAGRSRAGMRAGQRTGGGTDRRTGQGTAQHLPIGPILRHLGSVGLALSDVE